MPGIINIYLVSRLKESARYKSPSETVRLKLYQLSGAASNSMKSTLWPTKYLKPKDIPTTYPLDLFPHLRVL